MRYAMSVNGGWKRSVKWLCVIGLMILLPSVGNAQEQRPSERPQLSPIDELFYLDRIDDLTTQRDYWVQRYELDIKERPECESGFPWLVVVVALAAGYVAKDLVD